MSNVNATSFSDDFKAYLAQSGADELRKSVAEDGFSQFLKLGLPTRKHEDWKYNKAENFLSQKWNIPQADTLPNIESELKNYVECDYSIVIVDGFYQESLSKVPEGLAVQRLSEARDVFSHRSDVFYREMKIDSFFHMSEAFQTEGLLLSIGRNIVVDKAVEIVHVLSPDKMVSPRLLVKADVMSEVTLVERFVSVSGEAHFSNSISEIFAEAGAHVKYIHAQEQNEASHHIGHINAVQNADSLCQVMTLSFGGLNTRFNVNSRLLGSGANSEVHSLYLTHGQQHADHCTFIDHAVPHCESEQLAKGILSDRSRAVFNGIIRVRQDAQKTNSSQLNNNLLLDRRAEVDTRPQLQVDADDVKAAHGATIGQMDPEELFYLQSRAIGPQEAARILALGFAEEVLFKISNMSLRQTMQKKARAEFEKLNFAVEEK